MIPRSSVSDSLLTSSWFYLLLAAMLARAAGSPLGPIEVAVRFGQQIRIRLKFG